MNVSSLLALDALSVADRVLGQVLDQLGRQAQTNGLGRLPPEELVARALVNWMTPLLATPEPIAAAAGALRPVALRTIDEPATAGHAADRNAEMAAALGACECWGEVDTCAVCAGDGAPGWLAPDRQLFVYYAQPAMRRLRADPPPAPPASPAARPHPRLINGTRRSSQHFMRKAGQR